MRHLPPPQSLPVFDRPFPPPPRPSRLPAALVVAAWLVIGWTLAAQRWTERDPDQPCRRSLTAECFRAIYP